MRIALVGPTHPYKGGIAQHTTELAHRVAAHGVDTQVWSWRRQYPARLYPGEQRVPGSVAESPPYPRATEPLAWDRPLGWLTAGRRARRERLDGVVLTWTTPVQAPPYLGLLRGWAHAGRTVALCHNVLPHEPNRFDAPLARAVLGRCDGLLVHSSPQAAAAAALAPAARVAVAALPPPALPRGAARDAVERRTLLFFGIVRPYKGLDVALRALAAAAVPADVRLIVAGELWTPEAEIRALIAELGLRERVDLRPGYVPAGDVAALFAEADAVVLPYRHATASIVPDLAHRHGLPVLATRVGTLASAVRDDVDGLLVAPEDATALGRAISRLYDGQTLSRLRAGVAPTDPDALWSAYVGVLLGLLGESPA